MLSLLSKSSAHLTSYGFAKSYQQALPIRATPSGVVAWSGSKTPIPVLYTIDGSVDSGNDYNRVYSQVPVTDPLFKTKPRREYVMNPLHLRNLSSKHRYNEMTARPGSGRSNPADLIRNKDLGAYCESVI